jgi:RNA recognition motif-containing protein
VKLSWWQKLLKAIGLYKEPVRPPRPERKPDASKPEARPPKSNVRNARSGEDGETSAERPPRRERGDRGERSERGERGERGERSERGERGERGGRSGERSRGGDASTVESARVYVGNLSYDVTEQDLQELFKGIGGVRNVEIVYNRSTHRSKGYGFVEMLHKDEAIRAVEVLHDQPFRGRKLTVSGAKSKGQDEREEADERPERESRVVSLAPLPVAAKLEIIDEAANAEESEPVIQTIVETVTETVTEAAVEETPAAMAEVADDETEPKSEVA